MANISNENPRNKWFLAVINYGDRIFLYNDMVLRDWVKVVITYCVPYCVATYGAARYAAERAEGKKQPTLELKKTR
jgi:hypothetical protein